MGPAVVTRRTHVIGSTPRHWRKLDVSTSLINAELRHDMQVAFPWEDQHLWAFKLDRQRWRVRVFEKGGDPAVKAPGTMCLVGRSYPMLNRRNRAAPPEHCGRIEG